MMARAHILQHVAFEGPGAIAPWLATAGYHLSVTRLDRNDALPEPSSADFVVILGGPMSVTETDRYPWLSEEIAFVRGCFERGIRILGVCLGAQLLARAAGASVYRNGEPEIGWFPVEAVDTARAPGVFQFPARLEAFHWHGETFDLPSGAVHLARSAACPHQGFQLGASAIALQFHLETTLELIDGLIAHGRQELAQAPWVQTEAELRSVVPGRYEALARSLDAVLSFLHAPAPTVPAA